jgi:MFS family permease
MVVGRILAGVGIGISSSVVPLYISEISPKEIRGALGSANQVSINVGILLAIIAGLPLADNPAWWRTMFYLAAIPAVLLFVGMVYSPESPRWLYKQGKTAEGEAAERQLWGRLKLEESFIATKATNSSAEEDATWRDLFGKRYCKVVGVGASLFLLQQFSGINAVVYYSTQVFQSAGISSGVAASALVAAANVIGTCSFP